MRLLSSVVGFSIASAVYGGIIKHDDSDRPGSIGPVSDLYVGNKVISPDGFSRSAVLAGSTPDRLAFPGPVFRANKGDQFKMNVVDQLTDNSMMMSTSIHWHGFVQKETSWADGVAGVTQCPITPGESFVYQFSPRNQAGTFWYHSHYSTQYCDGLRGPIVVYDPDDPHQDLYDVDDESTIITLADWYHKKAPIAQRSVIPDIDATLINGLGRYAGGPPSGLAVVNVSPTKRYRFRLISVSCYPNFNFSIDGHSLTVIEADAVSVHPVVVDQIEIFAGQRYSFVLEANQPIGNYWIRAQPNLGNTSFNGGINSAILRYQGAPIAEPTTTKFVSQNPLRETDLHPLTNPAAPGKPEPGAADVNLNLNITFDRSLVKFTVNGAVFKAPTVPVLLQILSGAQSAHDLLPSGSIYSLPPNKIIELTLPGGSGLSGSPHPIHLHGHSFSVVRSAGSSVYNYENPVRRDVVNLGMTGDNVTIRFRTDNSGPWIMHCHIDWHLELGLSVVFAEDIPSIAASEHPPAWDQLCPAFNALAPQTFQP